MVAGLINATGKVHRMLDEDKIRKVDIVLACLLFFDPTGGNGNTAYSVCRYALILSYTSALKIYDAAKMLLCP